MTWTCSQMPTPLLLAYDPACLRCCRLALGLARRDQLDRQLFADVQAADSADPLPFR